MVLKKKERFKNNFKLELKSNHDYLLNIDNRITQGRWKIEDWGDFTILELSIGDGNNVHQLRCLSGKLLLANPNLLLDSIPEEDLYLVYLVKFKKEAN
jgi:hypothetical protein